MKLNIEQRKIIKANPNGHMLVKGVAGSGKTTVAVNRIPELLNNYCKEQDDKVLMLTYNKSLINYVKYIYEETKEERFKQLDITDLYQLNMEDRVDIKTVDTVMYRYFSIYKKVNNINLNIANNQQIQNALIDAIVKVNQSYKDVKLINTKNLIFLSEEIKWIKACNYMQISEYQVVDRLGRTSLQQVDSPQKLRKNSKIREAIFKTMIIYNQNLRKNNLIDFQDMALIALEQIKTKVEKSYTHIIIDETQDLTRVQLEFIKYLYKDKPYSSLLFVADNAQSIYPQSWLVKGRSFASIGFDMTGKSNSLSKNYRTTTQIAQAAYSLIEKDKNIVEDDNFIKPSLVDKYGVYPVYRNFSNKDNEAKFIIDNIKKQVKNNYKYKDIAIVAKRKNQLKEIKSYLEISNLPYKEISNNDELNFKDDSITLLTMHSVKGLEFKIVMIIGLNDNCIPSKPIDKDFDDNDMMESRDRKLLYVGMTRATERLFLTSDGEPTKFIKDIDTRYLKLSLESEIRKFENIEINQYKYKDKVEDKYSYEEEVRQWMISQLCSTYGYPNDLLDIECKVNIGSRIGLVDIVVYKYKNETKLPYIFIEVKKMGSGIENAMTQLQSYMSNSKTVMYGIATDGNEIKIINNNFEQIDDIPKFDVNMLQTAIENFIYIDINNNKKYNFSRDLNNSREIILDNEIENDVLGIPVFSEIAAGKPVYINDELQGEFYLPSNWVKKNRIAFSLKVRGNSMIKANINNDDLILIKKQSTANNGDIVAVDIDGYATLKRLMLMGSNVLLIPENDDYEPIMLPSDEIRIIGTAVGIIKIKS